MNLLQSLQTAFPGLRAQAEGDDYSLEVSAPTLHDVLKLLKREMGFICLLDIVAIDSIKLKNDDNQKRFLIVYHLLHMEAHKRLRVKVEINESDSLPNVCDLWIGANWIQREVSEMLGITFEKSEQERLLTQPNFPGFPLRKDWVKPPEYAPCAYSVPEFSWLADVSDDERLCRRVVDIKPSHPAIQGTFVVRAEVLGDKVKRALVDIGMQHRGVEKLAETKLFSQFIPYAERLNFSSPVMGAVGWAKTIEDALEVEVTDRTQAIRMILMELSRVMDHATGLAAMAHDLRAWAASSIFNQVREIVSSLFASYSGSRLMGSSIRIGGLVNDLPVGWVTRCLEAINMMNNELDEVHALLTRAPSWLFFHGEAGMSATDALDWGFSGPCLRACGVNYDLRKNSPYYFYQDVEFEVPLGINGDPYDRYLVRVEEMRQSLRIVSQVLDHIPSGPINTDDPRLAQPSGALSISSNDYAKHFDLYQNGPSLKPGEYYGFIESANGELGFYLVSDGSGRPYRLKIRGPSFYHFQSFTSSVKNVSIDSAAALLASLNAVSGEIDR